MFITLRKDKHSDEWEIVHISEDRESQCSAAKASASPAYPHVVVEIPQVCFDSRLPAPSFEVRTPT